MLPVLVLALAAAVYSPGYLAGHGAERANVYWFFLNLTVAAMLAVGRICQLSLSFDDPLAGKLLFLLIELIRGKPVKPEHEGAVQLVGMLLILALFVFVTYHDIMYLLPLLR